MVKKRILIVATKNMDKVREIKHILKPLRLQVLSLLDLPKAPDIKENGRTFDANAIKKARAIVGKFDSLVLADDSGLEVKALGGKPGIRSARYAGLNPTTEKLCAKLLKAMKNKKDRRARFVCVIALADKKWALTVQGICNGRIGHEMKGTNGFGYDPVFIPEGYRNTFAQMPLSLKNRISHRGRALKKAKACIARIFSA